jgi:hypothetical protein
MSKFQKVKKINSCNHFQTSTTTEKDSTSVDSSANKKYQNLQNNHHPTLSTIHLICPIPEIAKIQVDNNPQNIYIMVFMSDNAIYQKYKTTHSFEVLRANISETYNFYSYYFHFQLPKTIQPFFQFDCNLETEINNNQREYVIIGWLVRSGVIIGILYVQMYNQVCQNYNILIIEDCPFICFLGSLTNTFFGLFLNNIRIVESNQ